MPAELWVPFLVWAVMMQIRIFTWVEESSTLPCWTLGPATLRMTPRHSWDHGYILEKGFHTPNWCHFFLPYIVLPQNCFEFRAIFLTCTNWIPKWVACLRIAGEPIWHQLVSAAVDGFFLPFCSLPVDLGPEAGVECGCCAAHTSAFLCHSQTHLVSPKSSGWKPETGGLSLPGPYWLQVFLQHVTEISLDHCLMSSSSHCETGFSFFLSL